MCHCCFQKLISGVHWKIKNTCPFQVPDLKEIEAAEFFLSISLEPGSGKYSRFPVDKLRKLQQLQSVRITRAISFA
jgi:hypothetical protein